MVEVIPRAPRLSSAMEGTMLILDGAWKDSKTIADSPRTLGALCRLGLVERALRQATPAYPKPRWWYRLTEAGKACKAELMKPEAVQRRAREAQADLDKLGPPLGARKLHAPVT